MGFDLLLNALSTVGAVYLIVCITCIVRGAYGLVEETIEVLCGVAIGRLGYKPPESREPKQDGYWSQKDLIHLEAGLKILQQLHDERVEREKDDDVN